MSSPRAGAILGGRYRLVRPLASGGMGTVWLAHHVDLEIDVAVKLIEAAGARRPDLLERFRREARAAAQLKTPHVVQILDFGVDDGTPYIAMELLQGVDLDAYLEQESTLSPERTLAILRPLCKALEAAHGVGIVHRDLKPANVFLARIGGEEVAKIVDFGIAKELHRGAEWTTGTAMVGSPLFMSPEQIRGSGHVDARTDVWALAVMAYLMLFGEPPFQGDGLPAIFYNIAHEPFVAPSARSPALAPLDPFFARGLARDLTQRYRTVGELLAGLEQAVRQLPAPSLAVARAAGASQGGTLASPGVAHVAPATTPPVQQRPSIPATPPAAVSGNEGTVSAFASSPRPAAPIGALARARSATMAPSSPGSARALVFGGIAIVVAVIGFVVLRGGEGAPPSPPPSAPAVSSIAEAMPSSPLAVSPSMAPSPVAAVGAAPSAVSSAAPAASTAAPAASTAAPAASTAPRDRPTQRPAGSTTAARPAPSTSSPARPAGSAPPKQTTVDPEWGVPVQR